MTGRRAGECELEILMLLDPGGAAAGRCVICREAPALLALARDVLLNELLPLLPPERRLDARLVANCMAIAAREAAADGALAEAIPRSWKCFTAALPSPTQPRGSLPLPQCGRGCRAQRGGEGPSTARR